MADQASNETYGGLWEATQGEKDYKDWCFLFLLQDQATHLICMPTLASMQHFIEGGDLKVMSLGKL